MENVEKHFGSTVRQLREEQGINQEDFAAMAGIHRTYVSSIELGKVQVSIVIAQKLATALGVKLSAVWKRVEQSSG